MMESSDSEVSQYEELFDACPAMIWHLRANGEILKVNQAVSEDLDMPKEDIEGNTIFKIFPLDANQFCADYRKPLKDHSVLAFYFMGEDHALSVARCI